MTSRVRPIGLVKGVPAVLVSGADRRRQNFDVEGAKNDSGLGAGRVVQRLTTRPILRHAVRVPAVLVSGARPQNSDVEGNGRGLGAGRVTQRIVRRLVVIFL